MELKRLLLWTLLLISAVACKYDDEALWDKVNSLDDRVTSLEEQLSQMNSDINSMSTIVNALENSVTISELKKTTDGYTITFSNGETITIKNAGENADQALPIISIKESEGQYYWTQTTNGTTTWLTDKDGEKIPITGSDAVTPLLKVSGSGYWMVSYDKGITYQEMLDENGKPVRAVGRDGQDGADGSDGGSSSSFFSNVQVEGNELVLTLLDGTEVRILITGEVAAEEGEVMVKGDIELTDVEGLKIGSLTGEALLLDNEFSITVPESEEQPQVVWVADENDNIILMARSFFGESNNKINIQSTAFALVATHPVFAPVVKDDFDDLTEMILASPRFQTLCNEVQKSVQARRDIFDVSNTDLLVALNNVLEDLCASESNIQDILRAAVATRAAELDIDTYPFYVETGLNKLIIRNTRLSPPYEYTVRKRDNDNQWSILYDNGILPARNSYGWTDIFKTVSEIHLGEPIEIGFAIDGEYLFFFDRTTDRATQEFRRILLADAFSLLGAGLGEVLDEGLGQFVTTKLTDLGANLIDPNADVLGYVNMIYGWGIEYYGDKITIDPQDPLAKRTGKMFIKILGKINPFYNGIKGTANEYARILWGFASPRTVEFCVSCYEGEITSCSQSGLQITSGDNQEGYSNQRLLLPLEVHVTSIDMEDGSTTHTGYHKVKFEVLTGGGSVSETIVGTDDEGYAQTYWTLGAGNSGDEQKVKVVVVDITTGAEISSPKYFTAKLKEPSDITIRLDWHKLSGNTDIDLHVVDPFGEEIYFAHMQSASGGWLDRDDVVGPGPEHVYWEDAPAGTYTVKVHYYGSESQAVTSYRVTINANDQTYGPYSGSLGYHQEVVIGTFTIPGSTTTRSAKQGFIEKKEIQDNKVYERKSY